MQAIILAGGKGTRLASRLNGLPKPLIDVEGEPLLGRQLRALSQQGVTEVVLLVNHAADQIAQFVNEHDFGLSVKLVDDGEPRGTAGATLATIELLRDRFIVVYGDTLFDIDIGKMLAAHDSHGADATLLLHPNDHPADSDLVAVASDGTITAFHPYPHPADALLRNLVNAAFYIVERRALESYKDRVDLPDFAKDLFPYMVDHGARLVGYPSFEYIKDIGTPARLDKASRQLRAGVVSRASRRFPQKAIFLDRDGTLNVLAKGQYISSPEQLELLPAAPSVIRALNEAEYRCVVVTNQPVIARGECSEDTLNLINAKLEVELGKAGAYLDATFFCPHHPDRGFPGEIAALKIQCDCRKPATGMVDEAVSLIGIDRAQSWMIGDSSGDLLAANNAGLYAMLVLTGEAGRDGKFHGIADAVARDLVDASDIILRQAPAIGAMLAEMIGGVKQGDLVLISGLARSGKTLVAAILRQLLRQRGQAAITVALDRWIKAPADRLPGVLGRYDLKAARSALQAWGEGAASEPEFPFYNRFRRESGKSEKVVLSADTTLVIEGVPALMLDLPTKRTTHRIHVRAEERARRIRVTHDMVSRGYDRAAAEHAYAERMEDEVRPVTDAAQRADFSVTLDGLFGAAQ